MPRTKSESLANRLSLQSFKEDGQRRRVSSKAGTAPENWQIYNLALILSAMNLSK
jgi:hypothetical protein